MKTLERAGLRVELIEIEIVPNELGSDAIAIDDNGITVGLHLAPEFTKWFVP